MTLCLLLFAQVAHAETEIKQNWSVRLIGLPIGKFVLQANYSATGYNGRAIFRTSGAAGAVAKVKFDIKGSGHRAGMHLTPQAYHEQMHTGRRQSAARLTFQDGRVTEVSGRLDAFASTAASQELNHPLDPFSAILASMAPQVGKPECNMDRLVFDGARVTRLTWKSRVVKHQTLSCIGSYDRIAGYSADQLAEATGFPMRLTYRFDGQKWRLRRAKIQSLYGPVILVRKD